MSMLGNVQHTRLQVELLSTFHFFSHGYTYSATNLEVVTIAVYIASS